MTYRTEDEALEAEAENRAERRHDFDIEKPDRWGRDPDWHHVRPQDNYRETT